MNSTLKRLAAVLFLSGFCSLVYQVAWLRLLRLIFGVSTASTAVVLAIFMGGLGLGGALLGRRAERVPNPLLFYSFLEAGIALSAAASPFLIDLARSLYFHLGGVGSLGLPVATVLRLGLSVLVLGVPTTLMGGTLPAVAQALELDADHSRRIVAILYGVNAAGAVAGAYLSTFELLELLGVRQTLYLACALNLLLAVVVRGMARGEDSTAARDVPAPPAAVPDGGGEKAGGRLILAAAFVVGFVFFLMEMVWYRMLAPILGGSSYTFGLILAVALFGIALGGLLYARRPAQRRPTLDALAWTCALEGLLLALPYALGDDLAFLTAVLRQLSALGFAGLVLGWTVTVCLVVLPAAVVSGYQFPLLVALLGSGRKEVGSQVGQAYAWNTWGAIAGSLAGGFGLLPLLGAPRLWRFSALFLVLLGLLVAASARFHDRPWRRLGRPLAAALATLLCCQALGPSAFWRHTPIGAGRFPANIQDANTLHEIRNLRRRAVVREGEGRESSVALIGTVGLALFINGKSDGGAVGDAPTTVMSGLLGALLHPAPRRGLVIGLGTGASAGWMAQVDTMERVDVLELEPVVGEFVESFAPVNLDVAHNPKVHILYGDGREHVLTTPERYDVIFSEPSNPYRAGVADFFSVDFYRGLADRLAPGGIFTQWVQGYEIDAETLCLVYATLSSVFPHVETWQVHGHDLLLVATQEEITHDFDRLRRRLEQEPYITALRWTWKVRGIEGLYSGFIGGPTLARHLAALHGGRLSTDDRPLVEFAFARNLGRRGPFEISQLQTLAHRLGADRAGSGNGAEPDLEKVWEAREVRQLGGTFTGHQPPGSSPEIKARRAARTAWSQSDLAAVEQSGFLEAVPSQHPFDELIRAETLIALADERAPAALRELARQFPAEAAFLAARRSRLSGDIEAAVDHLVEAFELLRREPWVFQPVAHRGLTSVEEVAAEATPADAERLFEALAEPSPVMILEGTRRETRVQLLGNVDFQRHCAEAFAPFEPYPVWKEADLRLRLECYSQTGHPLAETARREMEAFYANALTQLDPTSGDLPY